MTLWKRDTGDRKMKHQIALYGEIALEEAMDLSKRDYGNEWATKAATRLSTRMFPRNKQSSSVYKETKLHHT
jgi:hypothetical protein